METKNTILFPTGYFTVFGSEFTARFCFWAVQSILVIYLTKQFLLSDAIAYKTLASYGALTYAATFFGGLLADKYFGALRILIIGIIFSAIGMFLLLSSDQQICYYGLGMLVVGMGLYVPMNASLLDNLYEKNDPLRDRGYFYLYVATNIGGIFGPICFGLLAQHYSFKAGFLFCGLLLVTFLWAYFFARKKIRFLHLQDEATKQITLTHLISFTMALLVMVFIIYYLIRTGGVDVSMLGSIGVCALMFFLYRAKRSTKEARKNIFLILFFSFISLFFFAMVFQVLTSVVTFTRDYVDKEMTFFSIPTSSFVSLEPFFIVVLAPVINLLLEKLKKFKINLSSVQKFSISFLLLGLSFLTLSMAAQQYQNTSQLVNPLWLVCSTFFMAGGEVLLMPVLLALVTKQSPENMKNAMVGFLYFCLSLASYLSGVVASLVKSIDAISPVLSYQQVYWNVFFFSLAVSALLWLLSRTNVKFTS